MIWTLKKKKPNMIRIVIKCQNYVQKNGCMQKASPRNAKMTVSSRRNNSTGWLESGPFFIIEPSSNSIIRERNVLIDYLSFYRSFPIFLLSTHTLEIPLSVFSLSFSLLSSPPPLSLIHRTCKKLWHAWWVK